MHFLHVIRQLRITNFKANHTSPLNALNNQRMSTLHVKLKEMRLSKVLIALRALKIHRNLHVAGCVLLEDMRREHPLISEATSARRTWKIPLLRLIVVLLHVLIEFLLRLERRTANRAEHASADLSVLVELTSVLKVLRA